VLTPYQRDLIHRESDGETTPEESVEVGTLIATQPEALAFMTSLRELDALFRKVPEHAPPLGLEQRIHQEMEAKARRPRQAGRPPGRTQSVTRWVVQWWAGVRNLTEELMQTKTVLIGAAAAVALIAVIGHFTVGYPPSLRDAGTIGAIGATDPIPGVQQAGRYRGRRMTEADVTLSNPEVQALFQDDKVLTLVQSDLFRTVMRNESFRTLQSNAAYQALQSNADFKALQSNADFKALQSNAEFKALQSNADFKALQSNAAFKALQSNADFKALQSNAEFKALQSNAEFKALQSNAAYQALQSNAAYQMLAASQTFRTLARDQAASEAFLSEAMRMEMRQQK
jgi:hypothetical protein